MAEVNPLEMKDVMLRLRNGNPEMFDRFLVLLQQYFDDLSYKVVQAPVDEVCVAQGRAQGISALLRLFKECSLNKEKPLPSVIPRP